MYQATAQVTWWPYRYKTCFEKYICHIVLDSNSVRHRSADSFRPWAAEKWNGRKVKERMWLTHSRARCLSWYVELQWPGDRGDRGVPAGHCPPGVQCPMPTGLCLPGENYCRDNCQLRFPQSANTCRYKKSKYCIKSNRMQKASSAHTTDNVTFS